jgi:hemerythrin superfamily protein
MPARTKGKRASSPSRGSSQRSGSQSQPDALRILKQDHDEVEDLFKKFDAAGDGAFKTKAKIVRQIIEDLSKHAAIEEQVFYPAVREYVGDENDVFEALEEHHVVKWVLSELDGMDPHDERYDAKVTVLKENVLHHAKEEEREMFPKVRKAVSPAHLRDLGQQLEKAKKIAPTHPHPRSPDEPPANLVAGLGAAAVDRGRDVVRDLMGKGRGASA